MANGCPAAEPSPAELSPGKRSPVANGCPVAKRLPAASNATAPAAHGTAGATAASRTAQDNRRPSWMSRGVDPPRVAPGGGRQGGTQLGR